MEQILLYSQAMHCGTNVLPLFAPLHRLGEKRPSQLPTWVLSDCLAGWIAMESNLEASFSLIKYLLTSETGLTWEARK